MNKERLIIRADGNALIGLGHVMRALALVELFRKDFDCCFAIQNPSDDVKNLILKYCSCIIELPASSDYKAEISYLKENSILENSWVILDGYHFDTDYQKEIKKCGCKLISIDDIHSFAFVSDFVINHAPGVHEASYAIASNTQMLLGLDYAILRKAFMSQALIGRVINDVKSIFICVGGADPDNITCKYLSSVLMVDRIESIYIVIGSAFCFREELNKIVHSNMHKKIEIFQNLNENELVALMLSSDFALAPASTVSIELAAVGIGLLIGFYVENQKNIYSGMLKNRLAWGLGDLNCLTEAEIADKLNFYTQDVQQINAQISNQKSKIDGFSLQRIRKRLLGESTEVSD